ncbi:unnamed protein product [Angiostrongylus costaricensis]|uniref:GPN-loop GTPase 2 n=1 Tax=Angiostrongylus costaricensis TaxID=334426 RepID=A0A158PIY5_ANGCS|nr:unnamed protein product [Angiostrongylus costaricensis]
MDRKSSSDSTPRVLRALYKPLRPPLPLVGNEVIVVRHSETIDEVFPDWIERSKLDVPEYIPFDLNMPVRLPRRAEMKVAYKHDPPLSEIGRIMTQIFARELVVRNAIPKVIYSSTSFASIQTAADIQTFIGKQCGSICVDPALASDRQGAPFWLTQKELLQLNYRINESYIAQKVESEDMNSVANSMKRLVNIFSQSTGLVLVVTDSLAVSMLMDIISEVERKYDQSEKQLRKEAEIAFPATSSIIFAPNASVSTQFLTSPDFQQNTKVQLNDATGFLADAFGTFTHISSSSNQNWQKFTTTL